MPPEYAVRGRFSMKSDVFSYGVIILEIVSGKKNREFSDPEHCENLLGHVNDLKPIGSFTILNNFKLAYLISSMLGMEAVDRREATRSIG